MKKEILKEDRIHGDTMFPFSFYTMNCSGENLLDCHWHKEFEFLMVTKGKAIFQVDTNMIEVCEGEIIFINSEEIHAGYGLDNYECSYCAVVFDPRLLYNSDIYDGVQIKYIDPILKKKYKLPTHIKKEKEWEKDIIKNFLNIASIAEQKTFSYEFLIKARIFEMFYHMLVNFDMSKVYNKPSNNDYKTERLKKILEYIHCNYSKKISLKELALKNNMSEGHFCRFFKQMLKKTPIEYINYYRINIAAKLLLESSKMVTEIGIDVGFENCSYFISTFKHYMKCTPSEYRQVN